MIAIVACYAWPNAKSSLDQRDLGVRSEASPDETSVNGSAPATEWDAVDIELDSASNLIELLESEANGRDAREKPDE